MELADAARELLRRGLYEASAWCHRTQDSRSAAEQSQHEHHPSERDQDAVTGPFVVRNTAATPASKELASSTPVAGNGFLSTSDLAELGEDPAYSDLHPYNELLALRCGRAAGGRSAGTVPDRCTVLS